MIKEELEKLRVGGSFRFTSKLPENFPEDRLCAKVLRPRAARKTAQTRRRDGRTSEIPGWDAAQVGEHPTPDFKAHQNSKAKQTNL